MKKIVLLLALAVICLHTGAQVSVNTTGSAPDGSAMLDVVSTVKGMLAPRMTAAQRDAIGSPAKGLLIYCTNNNQYYYNMGTPAAKNWVMVNTQWLSNGSNIYYNGGYVGIGTSTPDARLSVDKNIPGYTANFGTLISPWSGGTNVAVGNDDADAVLYVGQAPGHEGFLIWQYSPTLSDAYFSIGTYNGSNNLVLEEYGGNVGVRTNSPAALFHVAEESPGYTGLFGTPISDWNSSTNVSIGDDNGPPTLFIGQSQSNKGYLYWATDPTPANAFFTLGTAGGNNPLVLQFNGGNVGIGTTAPYSRLEVDYGNNCSTYLGYTSTTPNSIYHSEIASEGDG